MAGYQQLLYGGQLDAGFLAVIGSPQFVCTARQERKFVLAHEEIIAKAREHSYFNLPNHQRRVISFPQVKGHA
jgi:hypothetical protein